MSKKIFDNFFMLNSFDRSGSSMVSKMLSKHPQIECLFQPTNSTIFRDKIYDYWKETTINKDTLEGEALLKDIFRGNFNSPLIKSPWFFKESTSFSYENNKVYLIKVANIHLKIKWISHKFPNLHIWGLIRNPMDILTSLVRNNFHMKYFDSWAFNDILQLISTNNIGLNDYVKEKILTIQSPIEKMALVIALNNSVMIKSLPSNKILKYENILKNTNLEMNKILNSVGLHKDFDFSKYTSQDYNVIGKKFEGQNTFRKIFTNEQKEDIGSIFSLFEGVGYEYE